MMVFPGINFDKRNDRDYKRLVYEDHQKGATSLFKLGISPTLNTPFEIMHLVYLGLTLKHLEAWINGKYGYVAKLSKLFSEELSRRYESLKEYCPYDFARQPRSLLKLGKLKATEFRHFLLYASSAVCKDVITNDHLLHLRFLVIAMRTLCRNNLTDKQLLIAKTCLDAYVTFAPNLYTLAFMSYNVHSVQHIVDDARSCGNLESISAFVYENNMPLFKKNIRNHPKPLQQFANRLRERQGIQHIQSNKSISPKVSIKHREGKIPVELTTYCYEQFKKYEGAHFCIIVDNRNNFCQLKDDHSLCKIENIFVVNDQVVVAIKKYETTEDVFEEPIRSSSVGIFKCKKLLNYM
uniref:Uncharacterized protein n=1 Tax=Trichogramma kaykai TaxID=54128 RepID=A0ABD2WA48_9HYME